VNIRVKPHVKPHRDSTARLECCFDTGRWLAEIAFYECTKTAGPLAAIVSELISLLWQIEWITSWARYTVDVHQ